MNEQICQSNGLMFDKHGNPRKQYVRISLDGTHCVMKPQEVRKFHETDGEDTNYMTKDVYLSEQEFNELLEFTGF